MRKQALISLISLAIISTAAGKASADYQADIVLGGPNGTTPGRVFVATDRYRLEPANQSRPTHLLVENASGRTIILDPGQPPA